MPLPTNRQNKLNVVLTAMRNIPGVKSVQWDDFDSTGVNVLVELVGDKHKLAVRLATIKKRLIQSGGNVGITILDFPVKVRKYQGQDGFGRSLFSDEGYDHLTIKLDVAV